MSSFYKSKSDFDKEKALIEQIAKEKEIEFEIKEAKNYLEKKIPPIINEVSDKVGLADKLLTSYADAHLSAIFDRHKNKN